MLFGCYRKGDANDPQIYTMAITAVLSEYSIDVIQRVTDPRTGLARKLKFMPNVAEIAEACDAAEKFFETEKALKTYGFEWSEAQSKYVKPGE